MTMKAYYRNGKRLETKNNLELVINFIYNQMDKNPNSQEAKEIRNLINSYNPLNFIEACKLWKRVVGNKCKWDFKQDILEFTDGEWIYDSKIQVYYSPDIWGNLHYGYIGKAVGFSEWTLLSGAGLAQYMAGTVPDGYWERRFSKFGDFDFLAAFDDPKDQNAIRLGFLLWDKYGKNLTKKEFIEAIRKNHNHLQIRIH